MEPHQPIPPAPADTRADKLALAGFITSLLGIATCGLTGVPGIVVSVMGLKSKEKKSLAIVGVVVGALSLVLCLPAAGMLFAISIPSFIRAREVSRRNACQENLLKIDHAKQQWALDNNVDDMSITPTFDVLVGDARYLRSTPICPSHGDYHITPLGDLPYCSLSTPAGEFAHTFPE